MFFYNRPVLRNEAGVADGGGGGSASPSLASMPDISADIGDGSSWESIKAQVMGEELPQGNPGQQQQGANDNDPWALPKQEPKPKSYEERLAARKAKQVSQTYEQQLQAAQQQLQAAQQLQNQQRADYRRLRDSGDIDGALRALGAEDFATVQRHYLQGRGAIPAESNDPHVQAMARQIQQMQARDRQQREAYQRYESEQRQQQERQAIAQQEAEDVQAIASDLVSLEGELPGSAQYAKLKGFPELVLKVLVANPQASLQDAAKLVRREYEAVFSELNQAFVPQQPQGRTGVTPVYQQPQRSPIQQRLPSAAAAPLAGFDDENDPGRWEKIRNAAMNG